MGGYKLNIPNLVTLSLIVVVSGGLGIVVFGGLGVCGYMIYDAMSPRLHWQVEPVIIHGYVIAAGMVEKDSNREYLNDISICLLYTSPSPRDRQKSRMPSSA